MITRSHLARCCRRGVAALEVLALFPAVLMAFACLIFEFRVAAGRITSLSRTSDAAHRSVAQATTDPRGAAAEATSSAPGPLRGSVTRRFRASDTVSWNWTDARWLGGRSLDITIESNASHVVAPVRRFAEVWIRRAPLLPVPRPDVLAETGS